MPRRHYADRLTHAEEARLRADLDDERRRAQALSRRLDPFMAGGLFKRLWHAAWRGNVPRFSFSLRLWRQAGTGQDVKQGARVG